MDHSLHRESEHQRLDSWKEIAAFFDRDERTVKRWEKERGLPVRRVPGKGKRAVFAYTNELRRWLSDSPGSVVTTIETIGLEKRNTAGLLVVPVQPQSEELPISPVETSDSNAGESTDKSWFWGRRGLAILMITASFLGAVALFAQSFKHRATTTNGPLLSASSYSPHHKPSPAAEDLYLKGRFYWNKRTPDDLQRSIELFTQVVIQDPNYAAAYVGLADAYNLQREFANAPSRESYAHAITAARRAVEIDDSLSEAHRTLAFDLFHGNWDFAGGEREFRRAIELNPNDVEAHHWYATALLDIPGRQSDALGEIEKARKLSPESESIEADRSLMLVVAGKREEGIRELLQMEEADPNFAAPYRYLSLIYFETGEFPDYFRQSRKAAELTKDSARLASIVLEERAFRSGGKPALYEATLKDMMANPSSPSVSATGFADVLFRLGRRREAFEHLRQGLRDHEDDFFGIGVDPRFESERNDPEFREILTATGIPLTQ